MSIVSHVMVVLPNHSLTPSPLTPSSPSSPLWAHCIPEGYSSDRSLQSLVQNESPLPTWPHIPVRTTIYVDNLDRCQVRQVATSTSPPNHRLPKRCRRRLSCVGALAGLRGYTAALIRTKCPCRKHSVVGQAAIIWMICQQCRELMAPMGVGMG